MTESLGVGRGLFSSGLIVGSTVAGIGLIPLGFLLDHYRVRRIMMPGLVPQIVAEFYHRVIDLLSGIEVGVAIHEMPNEVSNPIPSSQDRTHAASE